jgi:hypothetical protein
MNSCVNTLDEYLQRMFAAQVGKIQRREAFLLQRSFHSPERARRFCQAMQKNDA